MNRLHLTIITACLLLSSCDMLEIHPYDVNISGERGLTQKNIELIESSMSGRATVRFAMISDTQGAYDETLEAVKALNCENIDFVLNGGDLSDYGMPKEFMYQRDIHNKLKVPYLCVIGNHDCLGTGREAYEAVFGPLNFAFTAGDVRFICLNTNALEYDYTVPVPDFGFMERELADMSSEVKKTVFLMHVKPFEMVFNNNVAYAFQAYVNKFPGVQFSLYGHEHKFAADDLFDDGIIYYQCPNIKKGEYLIFTINADGTHQYELKTF